MFAACLPGHLHREDHHGEKGRDFERGEQRADPLPVAGGADPVEVVAGAEDTREQRKADDDIEPLLDDLAVDAVELDHQESEYRSHDQLPNPLDPEMDDVPPVHLVDREIRRIVEREQEEDRDTPQSEQEDVCHRGLAALERGHGHVEQEHQAHDNNADLDDERLFEELAAFMIVEKISDHCDARRSEEHPKLDLRKQRTEELRLCLFRQKIIGRAHEADQRPDDERVGMNQPDDVQRQKDG